MNISTEQILNVFFAYASLHSQMSKRLNYYEGRHKILFQKEFSTDGSLKNQAVTNFCKYIIDMHTGALTTIPFQYVLKEDDADSTPIDELTTIIENNDLITLDAEHFRTALICGYSVELHSFVNNQIVITQQDPREFAFIFDDDKTMKIAIRKVTLSPFSIYNGELLTTQKTLFVVYDEQFIREYELDKNGKTLHLREEHEHLYGRIPIVLFSIAKERAAFLSDEIMNQNDIYNKVFSASIDDVQYNTDAILLLKGYDPKFVSEHIDTINKKRLLPLEADGEASYITKGNDIPRIEFNLNEARETIHLMGVVPDVKEIVGATGTASGIALQLKFQPMQQQAGTFKKYFLKSLTDRIDLINVIWQKLSKPILENFEVVISFKLPVNSQEIWNAVKSLQGIVSKKTLLKLIPEVEDPESEMKALEAETSSENVSTMPQNQRSPSNLAVNPSEPPETQVAKKEATVAAKSEQVTNSVSSLLKTIVKPIPKEEIEAFKKSRN